MEKYKAGKRSKMTLDSVRKYLPVNGVCVLGCGSLQFHRAALPALPSLLEGKQFLCVFIYY